MTTLTRGERFKGARLDHNQHGKQTMDDVAAATGVSKSLIQALEDDENDRSVGYDKVAKLAAYYGVSANWLLCLDGDYHIRPSAVDELGLSQKNIDYLKNPSVVMGRGATVPIVNTLVRTFINDVLDICQEERLHNEFQVMQNILARINGSISRSNECLLSFNDVDEYIRRNGLFLLPAKDGAAYYAKQIGDTIAQSLIEKYVHPSHRGTDFIDD